MLEPVLANATFKTSTGEVVIKLGDQTIPFHGDFKFYLTTILPNPHYYPEVSVKVALLNFTITPDGLEEQLLNATVEEERSDLAELKVRRRGASLLTNSDAWHYTLARVSMHILATTQLRPRCPARNTLRPPAEPRRAVAARCRSG